MLSSVSNAIKGMMIAPEAVILHNNSAKFLKAIHMQLTDVFA